MFVPSGTCTRPEIDAGGGAGKGGRVARFAERDGGRNGVLGAAACGGAISATSFVAGARRRGLRITSKASTNEATSTTAGAAHNRIAIE
jgi:hypothetical protein